MIDKYGTTLMAGDIVEVWFYSFVECISSCICKVTVDGKLELLQGEEPINYCCREIEKISTI